MTMMTLSKVIDRVRCNLDMTEGDVSKMLKEFGLGTTDSDRSKMAEYALAKAKAEGPLDPADMQAREDRIETRAKQRRQREWYDLGD